MSDPATGDFEISGTVTDASDESLEAFEEWLATAPPSIKIRQASLAGIEILQSQAEGGFFFKVVRGRTR